MQDLQISIFQYPLIWENPQANREAFELEFNKLTNTDLILLPEMFTTGFTVKPAAVAETMKGPSIQWMHQQAIKRNVAIAGSLIIEEDGSYYNRMVWMSDKGEVSTYDKRHLFRMGKEHERFGMGTRRLIIEYKGWKILPMVCYDLRFPCWTRNRLQENVFEYDFLFYLANWPAARREHWKALIKARAIENQSYVAGVNRVGKDGEGIIYAGDTQLIGPKGEIIAETDKDTATILTASLKAEELKEYREKFKASLDWDTFYIPETNMK